MKKRYKSLKHFHISSRILLFLIILLLVFNMITIVFFNSKFKELDNIESAAYVTANSAKREISNLQDKFTKYSNKQNNINNNHQNKLDVVSFSMFTDFGVVGDSHASGSISVDGGEINERMEVSWGKILARRNGNECINFSIGGCTTDSWLKDSNERGLKLLKESRPLSLYILGLGINDCIRNGIEYLGSIDDIDKIDYRKNANSFYGNYARIISEIKLHNPSAKIIMMTMADNWSEEAVAYNNAIIEIADICDVPCIHLHENEFFKSDFYKNNLQSYHPTAVLYSGMAVAIEEMIEQEMINNIQYFQDYIG